MGLESPRRQHRIPNNVNTSIAMRYHTPPAQEPRGCPHDTTLSDRRRPSRRISSLHRHRTPNKGKTSSRRRATRHCPTDEERRDAHRPDEETDYVFSEDERRDAIQHGIGRPTSIVPTPSIASQDSKQSKEERRDTMRHFADGPTPIFLPPRTFRIKRT